MTGFFKSTSRSIFGASAPKTQPVDPQLRALAEGNIAMMARIVQDAKKGASRTHR